MASYQELLKVVEVFESNAVVQAQGTINVGNVLAGNGAARGTGYEQLLAMIDKAAFEGQRRPKEEKERVRPQQAAAPVAQAAAPAAQAAAIQAAQGAAPAYEAGHVELKEKARQELSAITGALPKTAPKIEEVQISMNMKDLVLPNLPIAEQVPELENIIEALRSNILDSEQLATVRKELQGLRTEMANEEAAMKKSGTVPSDSEEVLQEVREQRLAAALAMVK